MVPRANMTIKYRWLVGVAAENRTDETSLSVIVRKAAERVVASSVGFQGKISSHSFLVFCYHMLTEHLLGEGWRTSLSVNAWKAAGRVVARLFGEGGTLPMDFCGCAN